MRRVQLTAIGLSLVGLLLASTASAAPTWLAPQDISASGGNADVPQVAVDAAGDAFAVWQRWNGPNLIIETVMRPAGAVWRPVQFLSAEGADAHDPQIAVDPAGDAVAVWYRSNAGYYVIQAAVRPAGGEWGAPQDLSVGGANAYFPQVAIDRAGKALAVWYRFTGAGWVVQAAERPVGGAWSAPQDLSAPGRDAEFPQVAFDPVGNAFAVWHRFNGANLIVQAAARPAGGVWSAPQDLSVPGQDAENAQVAFDPAGNAMAVWERFDGTNWMVQAAEHPAGGAWAAPQDLSAAGSTFGQDALEPEVAMDAAGNTLAIWTRYDGTNGIIQAAERPVGGSWGPAQDLSASGRTAVEPQLAIDPAGNALAIWRRYVDVARQQAIVQAARRPAGGAWEAPQNLSPVEQEAFGPQVAVDAAGNGVATWIRFIPGMNPIVQAAALDAAGPVFDNLSVPARGSTGSRLAFSARSFDVWSAVAGRPHWSFGDGGSADGWRVRHTFARAGSYTVTLSQSDAVGNQSTISRAVAVAPGCVVPKVVGKTLVKAKAAIKRRHCRTGGVARAFSKKVRRGRVLAQHPRAGKHLAQGARVNLVVSRGRRR